MFKKPWTIADGIFMGIGLIAAGLLLQLVLGPIVWSRLAWPANILLLAFFLLLIDVMFLLRKKVYAFSWMMHYQAAVSAIACALCMTVLMGLTVQTEEGGIPGLSQMVTFWPFVLVYTWLTLIAGLTTLNRISRWSFREIPFILNHLGVFVALTCGALGSADLQQLQMTVQEGQAQWQAEDENGMPVEPGLAIELHDFTIDEYPPKLMLMDEAARQMVPAGNPASVVLEDGVAEGTLEGWHIRVLERLDDAAAVPTPDGNDFEPWDDVGSTCAVRLAAEKDGKTVEGWVSGGGHAFPSQALALGDGCSIVLPEREHRRYASDISVFAEDGKEVHGTVEVNKPLKINGWKIYQYSYDERLGKWSDISVFELVRDPWLPAVYAGIFMMLAGAVCLFLLMAPKPLKKEVDV